MIIGPFFVVESLGLKICSDNPHDAMVGLVASWKILNLDDFGISK